MRKLIFIIIISLSLSPIVFADANGLKRPVYLEWNKIDHATQYQVQITDLNKKELLIKNSSTENLKLDLSPGEYQFRIRGIDRRGVRGEWSTFELLSVKVGLVKLLQPIDSWEKVCEQEQTLPVVFKWSKAPGAEEYLIQIKSNSGNFIFEKKTQDKELTISLPAGDTYIWSVQSISNLVISPKSERKLTLLSMNMTRPNILPPKNDFARSIIWTAEKSVTEIDYEIYFLESENQKWIKMKGDLNYKEKTISLPLDWPGGMYRIEAIGKKNQKPISEMTKLEFKLRNGDRSVAAENKAIVDELFNRAKVDGYFFNYIFSDIQYQTKTPELNSISTFSAVTGALSFGMEKLVRSELAVRAQLTLGGISINKNNYLLKRLEITPMYRAQIGESSDMRIYAGIYYTDIPEVQMSLAGITNRIGLGNATGLITGIDYWRAIFGYYGIRLLANYNQGLLGQSELGNAFRSSNEYVWGVTGSYRLERNKLYSIGYKFKTEKYHFSSAIQPAQDNEINISGSYFFFDYQWEYE